MQFIIIIGNMEIVMSKIQVLDCTLRDGGYCNEWRFGYSNIIKIMQQLIEANIDIIECGFLNNNVTSDKNTTLFSNIIDLENTIPKSKKNSEFVVMMNYGEYDIADIPEYCKSGINGIRVAFHKKDYPEALKVCKKLIHKKYKVYVQAMVSLNYSDEEFLDLIKQVNEIEPYAFYIVDSFGKMAGMDVIRLFYLLENNLKESIVIGFHTHNNMQLSFSNAQQLVHFQTKHRLIIDSSVYGMGRGAGNLNTELFVQYLNEYLETTYKINPLLTIIDDILYDCYQKNPWGYSLPNYLSAIYNMHPNYAEYLDNKKTLTIKEMNDIFYLFDDEKKTTFDKVYVEELYLKYMSRIKVENDCSEKIKRLLSEKNVLLIAPGKSSFLEKEKIIDFKEKHDVIIISINFEYEYLATDFIFVSNGRRYRELDKNKDKCIITSNILANNCYIQIPYESLTNNNDIVEDNAGMMAVKWLLLNHVKKVYLAGFDGYSYDITENYIENKLEIQTKKYVLEDMNKGMKAVLEEFSKDIQIQWITSTKFIKLENYEIY